MQKQTLSTKEAAALAMKYEVEVTTTTIANWCKRWKIGKKVGGRYRVSKRKLMLVLEGRTWSLKEEALNRKRNRKK